MSEYKDSILVLRTYKLGESDRILSCLSKEHGKVRVVAKGARKPKGKFGGRIEPFTELNASLWRGRGELDTLRQVDVISLNSSLHEDLDKMMKAATVVELVDKVSLRSPQTLHPSSCGASPSTTKSRRAKTAKKFALSFWASRRSARVAKVYSSDNS